MGAHLDRAKQYYHLSRLPEMQKELHEELAAEPECPRAHAWLALCLLRQGNSDGARAAVGEAIRLAPDMGWAHYVRACILFRDAKSSEYASRFVAVILGRSSSTPADFGEAETAVLEALRLDSPQAYYFEKLAEIRKEQGRPADALEAVEQGLKIDPQETDCLLLRAKLLEQLGRAPEAGESYRTALAQAPENAAAHQAYGLLLFGERKPDAALEHLREALRLDPNSQEELRPYIVAALKRRHVAYRLALGYLRLLGRAGMFGQLAFMAIAGGAVYFIAQLARQFPSFAVPIWTVEVMILALVCFLAPAADPLFNLVLRLNRFGRLVLSRDQIAVTNWAIACLTAATVALGTWLTGPMGALPTSVFVPLLSILVIGEIFEHHTGRWRAALLTASAAAVAAAMVGRLLNTVNVWFAVDDVYPLDPLLVVVADVLINGAFGCVAALYFLSEAVRLSRRCWEKRKRRRVQAYGVLMVAPVVAAYLWMLRWDLGIWREGWPNLDPWPVLVSLLVTFLSWQAALRVVQPRASGRKSA